MFIIQNYANKQTLGYTFIESAMKSQKKFDREKSILRDVYVHFSVNDPGELQELYMKVDQELMLSGKWDYKNPSLVTNQIKEMIEEIGIDNIKDEKEKKWIKKYILWMWYHHAISCALSKYGDKEAALEYSITALNYQPIDHPNKITRLLYLLIRDDLASAEEWQKSITKEPEKSTAEFLVNLYKRGDFFKPNIS